MYAIVIEATKIEITHFPSLHFNDYRDKN